MNSCRLFLVTVMLAASSLLMAQQQALKPYSWDEFVQEIMENNPGASSIEGDDNDLWQETLGELEDLHNHPFAISSATTEQLAMLPFLDDEAIEQILTYLHRHGGMDTWGELMLIPSLTTEAVKALPLFCTLEKNDKTDRKSKKKTRQELSSRMEIPLYYRKGFLLGSSANGGTAYVGNRLYNNIRYKLESRHVDVGAHVEKDPGENFGDSYGGFVRLHDYGVMKQAVLGDYRIGFGEGLALGSYGYGKSSLTMRTAQGIKPQTGMSETEFMRGAAVMMGKGEWTWTIFTAYNTLDATLSAAHRTSAQTIVTDGLHRTEAEREKKGNLHEFVAGGHLQWENKNWYAGATAYYSRMDRMLLPYAQLTQSTRYREIFPSGRQWGVVSANYGYKSYRWTVAGETAMATQHCAMATVNRVTYMHSRNLQFSAVARYYGDRYYSRYSAALSENSRDQNETGILLRMTARPADAWMLQAYADFFYFHWPRYGQTHSDAGQDFMGQATWTASRRHSLVMRYQLKRKEERNVMQNNHNMKVQWTWNVGSNLKLTTTGSTHGISAATGNSLGWGVMENVRGQWLGERLTASLTAGFFHTDDYNARVYLYEPSLWNASTYNTYYGEGIRLAATLRWQGRRWMAEVKYGMTHYLDRTTIGTAQQTIFSPTKQDVGIQIRIRI